MEGARYAERTSEGRLRVIASYFWVHGDEKFTPFFSSIYDSSWPSSRDVLGPHVTVDFGNGLLQWVALTD